MWYKLEEVFKIVGLPYSRQGSYEEDEKSDNKDEKKSDEKADA